MFILIFAILVDLEIIKDKKYWFDVVMKNLDCAIVKSALVCEKNINILQIKLSS